MNRFAMGTLAFAALGILATGCKASFSGDGHSGNVTVNDPGSSSGAKNPGGNPTGAPVNGNGNGGATPRCHTSGLQAGFAGSDAGAGQRYLRLVLANTSGHACRIYGWPGLGLGTGTASISTNAVRTGTPTSFVIPAGGHAHAKLHWTVVPSADEPQSSACEPTPAWIYVTPPNETTQLQVPWSYGAVCGHGRIDLTPLAAGPGA
jgi:Protein of unknown function (DUF4232)